MGGGSSKVFRVRSTVPGQDASAMEDFRALGLSNDDINALFRVFCKFDIIGDGELEYAEFTVQCKIEESKISREIFHDINTDNDAGISFREFVVSLWLYLVKTKEALAEFVSNKKINIY